MARPPRPKPRDLAVGWPDVKSEDLAGEVARLFALNVRHAMGDRSIRSVAAEAGIDHVTLGNVLKGDSWPDLVVIARLEYTFGVDLWPGRVKSGARIPRA
ncbi:helix-turn-helix transcriptional regulator [Salinibacterium sp. ZJ450]|uniref:helix-turn-helix transcriptional regulator n=1 Tax=Salinibacterium sp. ZJ450 TaxID=2708338 RepID=UPI001424937B|nr:helix-turn-helix transcriptional regulator [Salinibacterium sp. ZJ450]